MIRLKFLGAVAVLSAVIATPALADHMIDEPGMYAFYHPNGDLGIGSSRPAEAMAAGPAVGSGNTARLRMQSHPVSARRARVIKAY
jgi:hypothetical protein